MADQNETLFLKAQKLADLAKLLREAEADQARANWRVARIRSKIREYLVLEFGCFRLPWAVKREHAKRGRVIRRTDQERKARMDPRESDPGEVPGLLEEGEQVVEVVRLELRTNNDGFRLGEKHSIQLSSNGAMASG